MRLVTTKFCEFKFWLSCIEKPHTDFHFQAGANWKDGELVFYLDLKEASG